jgi:hypothetical protein
MVLLNQGMRQIEGSELYYLRARGQDLDIVTTTTSYASASVTPTRSMLNSHELTARIVTGLGCHPCTR